MKTLAECRAAIDAIDREIVRLFEARMAISRDVAAYKIENGLPVLDERREALVIEARRAMLEDPALAKSVTALFECIMAQSRSVQSAMVAKAKEEKSC